MNSLKPLSEGEEQRASENRRRRERERWAEKIEEDFERERMKSRREREEVGVMRKNVAVEKGYTFHGA